MSWSRLPKTVVQGTIDLFPLTPDDICKFDSPHSTLALSSTQIKVIMSLFFIANSFIYRNCAAQKCWSIRDARSYLDWTLILRENLELCNFAVFIYAFIGVNANNTVDSLGIAIPTGHIFGGLIIKITN